MCVLILLDGVNLRSEFIPREVVIAFRSFGVIRVRQYFLSPKPYLSLTENDKETDW